MKLTWWSSYCVVEKVIIYMSGWLYWVNENRSFNHWKQWLLQYVARFDSAIIILNGTILNHLGISIIKRTVYMSNTFNDKKQLHLLRTCFPKMQNVIICSYFYLFISRWYLCTPTGNVLQQIETVFIIYVLSYEKLLSLCTRDVENFQSQVALYNLA